MDGEGRERAPETTRTQGGPNRFAIGKSEAVPVVLQWLENNYEQHFDESTPKQDVYNEYSDFCKKHRIEPTSASAFGRLVRLAFPATTSRRLGARGANVTVYNHFRRREDADSRSIQLTALSQQPPSPSGPPSLNSLDGDNRLRGGGSSKVADGRTASVEDLKQGRTSSLNGPRSSIDEASRMDQIDEDEPDEESLYKGANSGCFADGVDGLLDQGFLSLAGRQHSTCTTPSTSTNAGLASIIFDEYQYDALEGGASGANLLMKMLKSEENGAELYDSLHRMLYGARADRKDGMELEEEAARINADADAAGKQLQLYRGTYQPGQQHQTIGYQEERKPGLWNADTHLHLMKLCETYRDCYTQNLWLLNPLHPAALEDDNIRYIMCTDEGAEERSPLSLSIYWILYSGALMAGHVERAVEFYSKAREHLGHVFDQTDSSISLVLLPMAYHSRFWADTEEDGLSKCAYYLTLAMEICKRIGCLGSSVYISCLQMYAWFCMTDNTSLSYENVFPIYEKLQEVKKGSYYPTMPMSLQTAAIPRNARTSVHIPISHLQMVEKMFGVVGNIMKGIFIFKSTVQPANYRTASSSRPQEQYSRQSSSFSSSSSTSSSHKRKQPEEPSRERPSSSPAVQHARQRRRSDPTETRLTGDDGRQHQQQHHDRQQQQQHHYEYEYDQRDFVAAYPNMFRANTTLQPLLLPLETMEQDLELLMKSDNPLPLNIYMMFKLWILGERAECFWCMGQPREALQMALHFLEVSKRSTKNFISHYVSIQPILEMVLNIFLAMFRFEEFRELLDAILEPLNSNIPHVARSKARYFSALFAANPVFSSSAEIDTSGTVPRPLSTSESGSDSPEGVSGSSGSESGGSCSSNRNSSAGRPGNASGSDESPPSYGGNDSSDEGGDQMAGLTRAS